MESLSGLDAAFWAAETDTMPLNVGGILVFDRGVLSAVESYDRILRLLSARIHLLPYFRKKVVNAPFGLVQPYWVDDPSFSLSNHVHLAFSNEEVSSDQVFDFAGSVLPRRFDRSRPLWDLFVIPRVQGNRFALIATLHHALTDGVSGMEALSSLFDLSGEFDLQAQPKPHIPHEPPSQIEVAAKTLFGLTEHALTTLASGASALKVLPNVLSESLKGERVNRAANVLVVSRRTGTSGAISSHRRVISGDVELEKLSGIAAKHGVKVNDVLIALCHEALVAYLKSHNFQLPEDLVAMVPVSIHDEAGDIESKNKVSAMFLRVPTVFRGSDDLLASVHGITDRAKTVHSEIGSFFFYNVAEIVPPVVLQTVFRFAADAELFDLVPPLFNYVVSNVPGPDVDLFLAGCRLENVIPMAPVADGSGITFAFVSYRRIVNLGLVVDPELYPDAEDIVQGIDRFLDELLELGE
ncbi:MAG: wax ester/triacylglycerol synthase family O-acyltransferase [Actinomycetota bacterium]|nr:MAG: wax ester/triacylglycerol synthase family O-acyltransferase [Actinomycetota bacterium]